MKQYVKRLLAVILITSGSYFSCMVASSYQIVPSRSGSNSIVDAIKKLSDITVEDRDSAKIWFTTPNTSTGRFNFPLPTFDWYTLSLSGNWYYVDRVVPYTLAALSAPFWFQGIKMLQDTVRSLSDVSMGVLGNSLIASLSDLSNIKPNMRKMLTNPFVVAALLAWSSNAFASRTATGVLTKIDKLIKVCKGLTLPNSQDSIATVPYADKKEVIAHVPLDWRGESEAAIANALKNLSDQTDYAANLLGQLRETFGDKSLEDKLKEVHLYNLNLKKNYGILIKKDAPKDSSGKGVTVKVTYHSGNFYDQCSGYYYPHNYAGNYPNYYNGQYLEYR